MVQIKYSTYFYVFLHKFATQTSPDFYTFPIKVILQNKTTFTFSGPFDYRMTRIGATRKSILERKTSLQRFS